MRDSIQTSVRRAVLAGILLGFCATAPAQVNEDEWYDPTDWFDGNNLEYDDTYDGIYDYDYDYDYDAAWDGYGTWGTDVWDDDYYDEDYWDNYDWDLTSSSVAASSTPNSSTSGSSASSSSDSQSSSNAGSNSSSGESEAASANQDAVLYSYVLYVEPEQGKQGKSSEQQAGKAGKSKTDSQQLARLSGTIEGLRTMDLQRRSGATGKHTIAKIKLENGKSTIVSLGRNSQLDDLQLKEGDKIEAIGGQGRIDGETVFVAHRLKAHGQTIAANPAIRLNQEQLAGTSGQRGQEEQSGAGAMTGASGAQNQTTLQGEVASVNRASAGQAENQHTLIDLKLENGRSSTVDLGPAASLEKIGLEQGDQITVRGHSSEVDGRPVLVADLLKIDGEKVSSVSR